MLYAVAVETMQPIRLGRMRRCQRVYVDAPDRYQAERLALQRFRDLRRPARVRVRDVERVDLRPGATTTPKATRAPPAPEPKAKRDPKPARHRRKNRRQRQRGTS